MTSRTSMFSLLVMIAGSASLFGQIDEWDNHWWTSTEGCKVILPFTRSYSTGTFVTVSWTGHCVDGQASGTGDLKFFLLGRQFWTESIQPPLSTELGRVAATISRAGFDFTLKECGAGGRRPYGIARLNQPFDLGWEGSMIAVLDIVRELIAAQCPGRPASSHVLEVNVIDVRERGTAHGSDHSGWCVNSEADSWYAIKPVGGRYGPEGNLVRFFCVDGKNDAQNEKKNRFDNAARAVLTQVSNERNAKANAEALRQETEKRNYLQMFLRKNALAGVTRDADFCSNPYQFMGNRIALPVRLLAMNGPNVATVNVGFCSAIVTGIPTTFLSTNNLFVLAGQIITPNGGAASVPTFKFVSGIPCFQGDRSLCPNPF